MHPYSFSLSISSNASPILFPVPQTNHYQIISDLRSIPESERISLNSNTSLTIFPKEGGSIVFSHTPLAIKLPLQNVTISQKESSSFFYEDTYINSKDLQMKKLADKWLLERSAKTPNEILKILYENTLEYLEYGNPISGLYSYTQALEEKKTDCGGFSTFLATLLQTQHIPCRLVVGYLYRNNLRAQLHRHVLKQNTFTTITMHAWLEVQTEANSWFPLDASVDWRKRHSKSTREGGFGETRADRLVLSFGHNHQFTYKESTYQFPILQHPEMILHAHD